MRRVRHWSAGVFVAQEMPTPEEASFAGLGRPSNGTCYGDETRADMLFNIVLLVQGICILGRGDLGSTAAATPGQHIHTSCTLPPSLKSCFLVEDLSVGYQSHSIYPPIHLSSLNTHGRTPVALADRPRLQPRNRPAHGCHPRRHIEAADAEARTRVTCGELRVEVAALRGAVAEEREAREAAVAAAAAALERERVAREAGDEAEAQARRAAIHQIDQAKAAIDEQKAALEKETVAREAGDEQKSPSHSSTSTGATSYRTHSTTTAWQPGWPSCVGRRATGASRKSFPHYANELRT
ncbi:hypothetical protein DFH27DRAFT_610788 [Peziza echinospora]|nr:hypothetical protein DFH27DRAFT_610788 [Peziza echinospora]